MLARVRMLTRLKLGLKTSRYPPSQPSQPSQENYTNTLHLMYTQITHTLPLMYNKLNERQRPKRGQLVRTITLQLTTPWWSPSSRHPSAHAPGSARQLSEQQASSRLPQLLIGWSSASFRIYSIYEYILGTVQPSVGHISAIVSCVIQSVYREIEAVRGRIKGAKVQHPLRFSQEIKTHM